MGKYGNCWMLVGLVFLAICFVEASTDGAIDEDVSEESSETSTIRAFVRSRFNLRLWSTTEASNLTESTTTVKPTTSTTTTTTEAVIAETTTDVKEVIPETSSTTISTTTVAEDFEVTTLKPKTKPLSVPQCGELNGDDVPWIAILEHTNPNGGGSRKKTLSKGVLIDDRHVLTTISSIHNSYPFWVVTGIRLGDVPTWAQSEGGRETNLRKREVVSIPVKNVFLHERKDIAVIRLAERVNITERVRPVCLPASDRFNYTELHFHICKKDKQQFGRTSSFSKLVAVTSLVQKDCQILFRRHQAELGPKEFCAWDETGDNCTGDLGGPLMAKLHGRYHVVGLNSYALAKSKIDSEGLPGVYVRVGSFIKWIQAVLKTEFDDSR